MAWSAMVIKLLPEKAQILVKSRLISGGIWAVGGKVFVLPLGLLISALLTRVLSPDDMGAYIFAQSIVLSGIVIAQLGLGPTAVRMIAGPLGTGDLGAVRDNVRNLLQWGLAGVLITAVLIILLKNFIGIEPNAVIGVSLWMIVLAIQKLMAEILRGFHDIRAAALIGDASAGGLISYIVAAVMLLFVWQLYGHIGFPAALTITVIAGATAVIWAFITLLRKLRSLNFSKGKGNAHFSWAFLYAALPVLVHTLATLLQNQSGIWMLEAFQPSSDVALYGVATRVVVLIAVPLNIVNSVVSPMIPDLFGKGETGKLERILRGLATLSTLPAVLALLAFIAVGPIFLELVFGEFYRAAEALLVILTVGTIFNVMAGSCGLTLLMAGHQKVLMNISIFSGLITITGVYLAAARWGTVGVAIVVSGTLLLKNLLMLYFTKRLTGIWTHVTLRLDRRTIAALLN
jgi:O-antigen/teichoic acid export membrane protein